VALASWLSPFIAGPDDSDLSLLFQFCCRSLIVSRIVPLHPVDRGGVAAYSSVSFFSLEANH
jgi:hypothetical protein